MRVRLIAAVGVAVLLASGGCGATQAALDPAGPVNPRSPGTGLGPVTKQSGCARGPVPDRACTPGAYWPQATASVICRHGYSRTVRAVSYSTKSRVYREYGLHTHYDGTNGEVDHSVPLALGGSNGRANLWPEAADAQLDGHRVGSHEKDALESYMRARVCNRFPPAPGRISLADAQREIATDWIAIFRQMTPAQVRRYDHGTGAKPWS
jgi:hypothetical protein